MQPITATSADVNSALITLVEQERPLVCFDFETTGPDKTRDRIVQYSFRKVNLLTSDVVHLQGYVDPQMPIGESAKALHGITEEDLVGAQSFRAHAEKILGFLEGCDLMGFHILSFDLPILYREFQLAGIAWNYLDHHIIDVAGLYKQLHPRTLSAAFQEYIGRQLFEAHDAGADTKATLQVFMAMLGRHAELPKDRAALALYSNYGRPIVDVSCRFTTNEAGEVVFAFGQHAGKPAKENVPYLNWMLSGNFPEDTKAVCRRLLGEGSWRAKAQSINSGISKETTDPETITTTE